MPELPEVENIKLQLDKYLAGHVIEEIEIRNAKSFQGQVCNILGGKIKDIRRFGKLLVIDLDKGYSLAIHVKMTGQLIYRGVNLSQPTELSDKIKDGLGGKYSHVIFQLDKDSLLYFNDLRKFGWIRVIKTDEVEKMNFIDKLGPEPLNDLTQEYFEQLCGSASRAIKTLLMDQSKIGGVGNIYANDALFLAKIHPDKRANKLTSDQVAKLYSAIEEVIGKGLEYGGSSQSSYVRPDGTSGEYQEHFIVYGKVGKPCPKCGEKIVRIKVGGRGSFYCPTCQKL